eukprot:NODE_6190_length_1696_cov_9.650733.p1 GENE.NODE_6190_length_1696_cov_9.650733~~NODE_6190_length_1696_cov_9.650733.p1  ORF type:complete len:482 (-),score=121.00 NODE_6190_length_1696_cov_9.650733:251-1633(-)
MPLMSGEAGGHFLEPWQIGAQNMYGEGVASCDSFAHQEGNFPPPPPQGQGMSEEAWKRSRAAVLRDWGQKREKKMHRPPLCLMDQMISGSGLFPVRLLPSSWLLPQELHAVSQLEALLAGTGRAHDLAMDLLSLAVYDIDVRVVLDNSGSMELDMFGQRLNFSQGDWISARSPENEWMLRNVLQTKQNMMRFPVTCQQSPLSPHHRRWLFARDAMRRWCRVFSILRLDPPLFLLNHCSRIGSKWTRCSQMEEVFMSRPGGGTPMTEVLGGALSSGQQSGRSVLVMVLTDGEANDMPSFNTLLDSCQNGVYGDVQICLYGLSLVPRDIEWFENEECDEIRIRTVEAYEVEAQQIRLREVVKREDGYTYEMHCYRTLVTNFFPADYDYEAPFQNLRHRLYITIHGRDRWYGIINPLWKCAISNIACSCCFIATGAHCCGWCQGNPCGKCQKPEMIEGCCGEE